MLALAACGDANGEDTEPAEEAAETESEGEEEEAAPAEVETVEIRMADAFPASNPLVVGGADHFRELVDELSGESINIEIDYLGDQQLASADEMFDAARDGVGDIAAVTLAYVAEEIPQSGVAELPGSFDSSQAGSAAFWEFVNEELLDEFLERNVRPVFLGTLPPYQILTVDARAERPEDIQGLNLRSPGGVVSDATEAAGATAVQMPVQDQYVALERGTVDGVVGPPGNLIPYNTEEVVNFTTTNLSMGSATTIWIMNEDTWQSLSSEAQDVIRRAGDQTVENVSNFLDEAEQDAYELMADVGVDVYEVPDLEPWEQALAGVTDAWVARMDDMGFDGTALLAAWEAILDG
jgi:TRAP-type C4-dicarboxylate transport system substrate-binding protein